MDIHSHLLPALDDGVQNFDDSLAIIKEFQSFGYQKIITTPHIMADTFRNSPETILPKLKALNDFLTLHNVTIPIEAAAEYYLDEGLMQKIKGDEPLLTIGKRFLLFETNFLNEPLFLKDFIFAATLKGYKLILAHPERYIYLQNDFKKVQDLLDRGVLFQVNLSSITGYYSKPAQRLAEKLISNGTVHFLASDCHNFQHVELMKKAFRSRYFAKAVSLPLMNNSLL